MSKKIRLVDIAEHADVSIATVSRVLNDSGPVSADTAARVLTAIDMLGYERPESLSRTDRGLIGLVVPELGNPIFPALAQELEAAMVGEGFVPVLCTQYAGGVTEDEYVDILRRQRVAGIIFVSGLHADSEADPARYRRLQGDVPFVTINGANPAVDAPNISTNDADAMRKAVEFLTGLGHTKIGLAMGPHRFIPSQEKERGYLTGMAEFSPAATPRIINTFFTFEGGDFRRAGFPRERLHSHCVRLGHHGPRRRLRGASRGPERTGRRLHHQLRRFSPYDAHKSAANHPAPTGRGHGTLCRQFPDRAHRRQQDGCRLHDLRG